MENGSIHLLESGHILTIALPAINPIRLARCVAPKENRVTVKQEVNNSGLLGTREHGLDGFPIQIGPPDCRLVVAVAGRNPKTVLEWVFENSMNMANPGETICDVPGFAQIL